MVAVNSFVQRFEHLFINLQGKLPWAVVEGAHEILVDKIETLGPDYKIFNRVAIHKTVTIDSHAILKGPAIISAHCFVGAHACIRDGVFLDEHVKIGPCCEVKRTFVFSHTALAHFNFVGDSILGSHINLEAGVVIANHFNERDDKEVCVCLDGRTYRTGMDKFGALVGDHTKIGANAVLSPGTILHPNSVVRRLELVDQNRAGL